MSAVHCFTSISYSYLSRARVLAKTIRRHHPDWRITLFLSDQDPPNFALDLPSEPFDRVLRLDDINIGEPLEQWIFKHNVIELCTAVKGAALRQFLNEGAENVIYIDPDIALFNPLEEVVSALKEHSIVLTPHLIDPEKKGHFSSPWPNELSSLLHGVYNLGFIGVRNDAEGRRFANWWSDRLVHLCYEEACKGIYTDQRWCDLVPAMFDRVMILRDPGYNVATWNLAERHLCAGPDGQLLINGRKLRFYHFTKIESVGDGVLDRLAADPLVYELVIWYRSQLKVNAAKCTPPGWWAFGKYSDGTPIAMAERILYRSRPDIADAFPNPFQAETYLSWLKQEKLLDH